MSNLNPPHNPVQSEFIEELCGPEIAHALDMECTKKKYIAQRLHVKTWENKK